jgi:ribonuclease P protein component
MREEDVPAEQPEAKEDSRLPDPDADPRRSSGHRPPAQQGSLQSLSLIWPVRDRAMFRALARGRRRRSGALEVSATLLDAPVATRVDPPRIAFAVGRPVGNAVIRNRVKRRLRAAARENQSLLQPGWGYLVRAAPPAASATYRELADALRATLVAHSDGMS